MSLSGMLNTQMMLFLIMLIGLYMKKSKMVPENARTTLTNIVVNITLPASIVKSFLIDMDMEILKQCGVVAIVATVSQIACYLISLVLFPGVKDEDTKKILQYGTICSNAGTLGNAVAEGVFGPMGLLYAAIYVMPQRVFMWSVGVSYFTKAPDKKTVFIKTMTNPCILSVLIGMVIMIFQIPLPEFVVKTLSAVGGANTFLAMAMIGMIMEEIPLKELPTKLTCYYCGVRLVLLPLLTLIVCRAIGLDDLICGVAVVLAAMPAANTTAVMASKYDMNAVFATKCVVFSTILSVLITPLWCIVL